MAGRKHQPTAASRAQAEAYGAVGVPHHQIALLMDISIHTLLKYYRKELDLGKAKANAQMAKSLFQQGMAGNLGAQIFWMKSQAGWREKHEVELTGPEGGPLQSVSLMTGDPAEAMRAYLQFLNGKK